MAELTLFTLPKGFVDPHVSLIQRNALASWCALAPAVEVIVMGDDPGVAEEAAAAGVAHVADVARNEFGTPLLDSAFALAAARSQAQLLCYVNADIILLADFVEAFRRLPRRAYLAIGRRWDTDVTTPIELADGGRALRELALAHGRLDPGSGSDYFVFRRGTDFGLPPFAVGRPGWDNWMIARALRLRLPLIDMTPSVLAIHQNHGYGHVAGGTSQWEGPEADRNRSLATGIERYVHSPFNATHVLTPRGLRRPLTRAHLRAKLEAFIVLRPAAAPLHRLIRAVRGRSALREELAARVICARLVRESATFFARELSRPAGIHLYRERRSGVRVAIRHGSQDAATLAEVFRNRWYDPPAEVAAAIGGARRILDLGANIGLFGALAATLWRRATIVGYEPDPANLAVHAEAIAANGLAARWRVIEAAAGTAEGEARFAAGLGASSHLLAAGGSAGQETTVAVADVMAQIAEADLLKMDIEGGEWPILADPRFAAAPPRAVVLEYHRDGCPAGDPRSEALALLAAAGMRTREIWHSERDGVGMLWAWRG